MAVFRVEKTKDFTIMRQPSSSQSEAVFKSERAFIADAVAPGGLGLYHERAGADL